MISETQRRAQPNPGDDRNGEPDAADRSSLPPLICVVDSDAGVRSRLKGVLRKLGASVEAYPNAEDFLAEDRLSGTSCLIAEVQLPGIGGIELQRRLRDEGSNCPVILLSHQEDVATAVNAIQLGAFDFIEKPFMNRVIVNLVAHALESSDVHAP